MHQEYDYLSEEIPANKCDHYNEEWENFPGKELMQEDDFKRRRRLIDESLDYANEQVEGGVFSRNTKEWTRAWLNLNSIKEGEYLRVSNTNLKKLIDPYSVTFAVYGKGNVLYPEYVVLAGLISSYLPEDKKLVFSSNGTFITKKEEVF